MYPRGNLVHRSTGSCSRCFVIDRRPVKVSGPGSDSGSGSGPDLWMQIWPPALHEACVDGEEQRWNAETYWRPHKVVVNIDISTNAGEEELEQSSQQPKEVLGRLAVKNSGTWYLIETPAARGPSIEEDCDCDRDTTVLGRAATPPCFPVCGNTSGVVKACDRLGLVLLLSSSEGAPPLLGKGKQGIES